MAKASDLIFDRYLPGQFIGWGRYGHSNAWTTTSTALTHVGSSIGYPVELSFTPPVNCLTHMYSMAEMKCSTANNSLNLVIYVAGDYHAWGSWQINTADKYETYYIGDVIQMTAGTLYTMKLYVDQSAAGTITVYHDPRLSYMGYMAWALP
jgi:hypothetical protein